jgi:hypothetical protein
MSIGPDPQTSRYNSKKYLSYAWYVKPIFSSRWGPKAWLSRLLGRKLPGDDGNSYSPQGYLIEEIGPDCFSHKGAVYMNEACERLRSSNRGGCPFA